MKRANIFLVLITGLALAASIGSANASPIGIDMVGSGSSFTTIDHLNYFTDTGLALGFNVGAVIPPGPSYPVEFLLQGRASGGTLNSTPVFVPGLTDLQHEMTFVADFLESVASQGINATGPFVNFEAGEDPNSIFQLWIDQTPDTVTNGPTGVLGYGDGVNVLSGHLLSLSSTFQFDQAVGKGNGQFTVLINIDSINPLYINTFGQTLLLTIQTTGTLGQPIDQQGGIIPPPVQMWNGTPTTGGNLNPQMFKFDGSSGFAVATTPEPSTILLLGAGLLGLGAFARRKRG